MSVILSSAATICSSFCRKFQGFVNFLLKDNITTTLSVINNLAAIHEEFPTSSLSFIYFKFSTMSAFLETTFLIIETQSFPRMYYLYNTNCSWIVFACHSLNCPQCSKHSHSQFPLYSFSYVIVHDELVSFRDCFFASSIHQIP